MQLNLVNMPINNSFLRWYAPPVLAGYQAPASAPPQVVDCLPESNFALPARPGDVLRFIFPNTLNKQLSVALLYKGVIVNDDVGIVNGIYGLAAIPVASPYGLYTLLIYDTVPTFSPWVTVSSQCEKVNGQNTGFLLENQERQTTGEIRVAIAHSDCLKVGLHRRSLMIRFRDDTTAFGFDYTGSLSFFQQFRLPVEIVFPDYQVEESVYRQSNGYRRFGNVYIDEKHELRTAALDRRTHQCLISACKHRYFYVDNCQYFAAGNYTIDNVERGLSATAKIDIFTQDFDLRNFGCGNVNITQPIALGDYSSSDYSEEYS